MSVYNTNNVVLESSLLTVDVLESVHDAGIKGAFAIIAESEQNWAAMMQAVGIMELASAEQNGGEVVYEANMVTGFIGKIKAFFVNMWEKIKGLFKKFISMIDSAIMGDKDFVKKYRDAIIKAPTKDFEFEGYNFTINDINLGTAQSSIDAAIKKETGGACMAEALTAANAANSANAQFIDGGAYQKQLDKISSNRSDISDKMRGAVTGAAASNGSEYAEELFKKLRKGEDKAETITSVDANGLLDIISNYKTAKKTAEDDMKNMEKTINAAIKVLTDIEKAITKTIPGGNDSDKSLASARGHVVKYVSEVYGLEKEKLTILQTANGAKMSAMRDQHRQSKAVCVKLISYKPKNESGFEPSTGSVLESVKFI